MDEQDFNEEIERIAGAVQDRMISDALFGSRPSCSGFPVASGTLKGSINSEPFKLSEPFAPLMTVIVDPYAFETVKRIREKDRTFWQKLWSLIWDCDTPWPWTPIEYYETSEPAIFVDSRNNRIICHPSLEVEIKKSLEVDESTKFDPWRHEQTSRRMTRPWRIPPSGEEVS